MSNTHIGAHPMIPRFIRLFCVPILLGWLAITVLSNVIAPQLEQGLSHWEPISTFIDTSDEDAAPGEVVYERILIDGCLVLDGAEYGDKDCLLSDEVFEVTATITDTEDVDPDLNGSLCIQLPSAAWYNTSLSYLSGDLFGINLTIPLSDIFLGNIDVYIEARDSDYGYDVTTLITTITVLNNQPQITGPTTNATGTMYRDEVFEVTATITDIEDIVY